MLDGIEVLCHSSIKISKDKIIYFDPFKVDKNYNDADYIFITHPHYDHFSKEDIDKVKKDTTKIVVPFSMIELVNEIGFKEENIIVVKPNSGCDMKNFTFKAIPAYNVDKEFHKISEEWVGYILNIGGVVYYIAGDTDLNEDILEVDCDVAFVPIGGTFTMDYVEASNYINEIKPSVVVPIHYGLIVGEKDLGEKFKELLDKSIDCKIYI